MSSILWSSVSGADGATVSGTFPDGETFNLSDSHPSFLALRSYLEALGKSDVSDEDVEREVRSLLDVATTISTRMSRLSERVTTDGVDLFLDGDHMVGALAESILAALRTDAAHSLNRDERADAPVSTHWSAMVNFLEKVTQNPSEQSRTSLFNFIQAIGLVIQPDGNFIAYKGVDGNYLSHRAGLGIVQGRRFENAHLDNSPGNTLEVPRSYVESDNSVACAQGLHVGSLSYAQMWAAGGKVLAVSVNPRDVVSVPRDYAYQKCRVNRYTVVQEAPNTLPTVQVWDKGGAWDIEGMSQDDYCEWCARDGDDCTCERCYDCDEVRDECDCERCYDCGELAEECDCEDDGEDDGDQLPPGVTAIFI